MTRKEEKQQLRRTIRAMERELSPKYKEESSRAICQHLIAMPAYQSAETVFCFVGMSREIDTTLILEDALNTGKKLCVPLCVGDGIMELRHITALDQLIPGAYGILEPGPDTPLVEPTRWISLCSPASAVTTPASVWDRAAASMTGS